MVYANDQWIQLPVRNLYDNLMMLAAINAAKDMYEKGQLEIKDFRKDYGDFISPFAKDMARYDLMVNGVNRTIDDLYAAGIDPVRSREGRAAVARAIRSINPAEYNAMKANAKVGYAYLDAMKALAAQGKFDPDMNNAWLDAQKIGRFEDFATAGENGFRTWDVPSPMLAVSLQELTSDLFKGMTPRELTAQEAKNALGDSYNSNKTYKGILYDDLLRTAGVGVPGLMGDWRMNYFRQKAAEKLRPNATQAEINQQFLKDVADANLRSLISPVGDYDEWATARYKNSLDIGAYAQKAKIDYDYKKKEYDEMPPRGSSSYLNGDIFRTATEDLFLSNDGIGHTTYVPEYGYYSKIDPVSKHISLSEDGKVFLLPKDGVDGSGRMPLYTLNSLKDLVNRQADGDKKDKNGNRIMRRLKGSRLEYGEDAPSEIFFEESGNIFTIYDTDAKKFRHFISGEAYYVNDDKRIYIPTSDGSPRIMEVKKRDFNYGKNAVNEKQKSSNTNNNDTTTND